MIEGMQTTLWERYLSERFGQDVLYAFRATSPTQRANRPQTADVRIAESIKQISALKDVPVDWLARDYGRFAVLTLLGEHPYPYLRGAQSAREVLLSMAASRNKTSGEDVQPSLILYKVMVTEPQSLLIAYAEPQKLCALLYGIIEGAAARFGEQVIITERTCMQSGATTCRFDIRFQPSSQIAFTPKFVAIDPLLRQQQFDDIIFSILPTADGMKLSELRAHLEQVPSLGSVRPLLILHALDHLLQDGRIVSSVKDRSTGAMSERRYWRVKQAQPSGWFGYQQ